jgi:hypothetical protein
MNLNSPCTCRNIFDVAEWIKTAQLYKNALLSQKPNYFIKLLFDFTNKDMEARFHTKKRGEAEKPYE